MGQTKVGIFLLRVSGLSDNYYKGISRLPVTSVVFNLTGFPFSPNPFKSTAKRKFRICVPDEWYRCAKPRTIQSAPAPSDSTMRRLAAMQSDEESSDEEGEGTARMGDQTPGRPNSAKDLEQRGLVTQGRLSSLFEGWTNHSPPSPDRNSASFTPENRKSVSEPRLVDQAIYNPLGRHSIADTNTKDEENADFSEKSFEEMLVSLTNSPNITLLQDSIGRTRTEGR
jgi:diaphanous 1